MSTDHAHERQGKLTLVAGVSAILLGFVLQAVNVQSFATQGPPMFLSDGTTSRMALLGTIGGLAILVGLIVTVVGIVRYAQSPSLGSSVSSPDPIGRTTEAVAFCSSCGARMAGVGRYCSSCGTPTAS